MFNMNGAWICYYRVEARRDYTLSREERREEVRRVKERMATHGFTERYFRYWSDDPRSSKEAAKIEALAYARRVRDATGLTPDEVVVTEGSLL